MKPYYEHNGIAIFLGDCREVLPQLPDASVDLVLTDPPYNVGKDYGTWNDCLPLEEYQIVMAAIVAECLRLAPHQAWVAPRYQLGFYLSLLPKAHLVVIRRGAAGPNRQGWLDQFEVALAIGHPERASSDLWMDIRLKGEGYFFTEQTYGHPGYTPLPIMQRFTHYLSGPGQTILDPFLGSGTALVAAKALGRKAIGIEIEERYCEIAAKRLQQEVLLSEVAQ